MEKRQINNLKITMTNVSQIQYDVDNHGEEPNVLAPDNLFVDFFCTQKAAIVDGALNDYEPVYNDSFTIFYPSDDIVLHRRNDHPGTFFAYEDGTRYIKYRTHPTHEPPIKHDTKLVFSRNTLMLTFNRRYNGDTPTGCSVDERRKRQITELAIKQSVINVFRKRSDKHIYMNGNDVLIEGRKLGGSESFTYDHGHHEHAMFTWLYEPELFEKYLKDDKNHLNSIEKRGVVIKGDTSGAIVGAFAGITGVANEIPGYTKREFAEDVLREMQYFLFMMK